MDIYIRYQAQTRAAGALLWAVLSADTAPRCCSPTIIPRSPSRRGTGGAGGRVRPPGSSFAWDAQRLCSALIIVLSGPLETWCNMPTQERQFRLGRRRASTQLVALAVAAPRARSGPASAEGGLGQTEGRQARLSAGSGSSPRSLSRSRIPERFMARDREYRWPSSSFSLEASVCRRERGAR